MFFVRASPRTSAAKSNGSQKSRQAACIVPDDGLGGGFCHGSRRADDAEVRVPPSQMGVGVVCSVRRCADSVSRVLVLSGHPWQCPRRDRAGEARCAGRAPCVTCAPERHRPGDARARGWRLAHALGAGSGWNCFDRGRRQGVLRRCGACARVRSRASTLRGMPRAARRAHVAPLPSADAQLRRLLLRGRALVRGGCGAAPVPELWRQGACAVHVRLVVQGSGFRV